MNGQCVAQVSDSNLKMKSTAFQMAEVNTLKGGEKPLPAFSFRKRIERIDWRKLASIDVSQVSLETDFQVLQDNIAAITFCDIESEFDTSSADPNLIKIFKLAQLIIEYLLHSQDYLTELISNLNEKLQEKTSELHQLQQEHQKLQSLIHELKKENKRRRKMLENQQQQQFLSTSANYSQCPHCPKAFVNAHFLQTHLLRRHPAEETASMARKIIPVLDNELGVDHGKIMVSDNESNKLLEKEVKELREKLKEAEERLENEKKTMQAIKEKFEVSGTVALEGKLKELEESKKEEMERHKAEIQHIKSLFMKELQELHEKHQSSEQALQTLKDQYLQNQTKSNLGELKDAGSLPLVRDQQVLERQQEEISLLQQKLREQIGLMETHIGQQLLEQEKKWKGRMRLMEQEHAAKLEQLKTTLEQCMFHLQEEKEDKGQHRQWYEQQIQELLLHIQRQEAGIQNQERKIQDLASRPIVKTSEFTSPSISQEKKEEHLLLTSIQSLKPVPAKRTKIFTTDSNRGSRKVTPPSGKPANSRAKKAVKQRPMLLEGLKEELKALVEDKLDGWGIKSTENGISSDRLKTHLAILEAEQEHLSKKYSGFGQIMEELQNSVDEEAQRQLKEATLTSTSTFSSGRSEKRKSILKKNVSKSKMCFESQSSNSMVILTTTPSEEDQEVSKDQMTRSPKKISFSDSLPQKKSLPSSKTSLLSKSPLTLSSSSSEEEEVEDSEAESEDILEEHAARQIKVVPRSGFPVSSDQPLQQQSRMNGVDDSQWDTNSDTDVNQTNSGYHEPKVLKVRPPTGEKVTALAQSLEKQLLKRKDEKPVGAVDVLSVTPSAVSQNKNVHGMYPENESDYSLSSVEDLSKEFFHRNTSGEPSPKNGMVTSTPGTVFQKKRSESVGSAWDSSDEE